MRRRCSLAFVLWLVAAAPVFAQLGAGGMGMGGAGSAPQMPALDNKPEFRDRVWQEGGPQFGPAQGMLVADVRVTGNQAISSNQIMSMLRTRRDRVFDPEVVQSDVRRLASKGLFRDVRTLTQPTPQGMVVTFEVLERPTMKYVRFMGNRKMSDKALRREAGIQPGDAMNQYAIEDARRKLQDYYHRRGFPKAIVEVFEGDRAKDEGVVFAISEGKIERILDVEFVGNTIATDARLKTQIQSKPGILWYFLRGKVERDKIDQDVEKLTQYYRNLGYFQARIGRELDYTSSGRWMKLRFVIDEGPRYKVRNVRVAGAERFENQALVKRMELAGGQFFHLDKMNKDLNWLRDLYGSQGFVYADVQADPRFLEEPGQLDLVYNIEEGQQFRVGRIDVNIEGDNPHTRRNVVLNRLSFRPGEIVDIRRVRDSERRLRASQLFETNPAIGSPPQISFGNPSIDGLEGIAGRRRPTIRGQSLY